MSEQYAWTFTTRSRSRIGPTCPACETIHCGRDVVAVNRFDANAPTRYMPASGGAIRATRAEAMADVCANRRMTTAPTPATTEENPDD